MRKSTDDGRRQLPADREGSAGLDLPVVSFGSGLVAEGFELAAEVPLAAVGTASSQCRRSLAEVVNRAPGSDSR